MVRFVRWIQAPDTPTPAGTFATGAHAAMYSVMSICVRAGISAGGRLLPAVLLLVLLPWTGLAQSGPASCVESVHGATVIVPDTLTLAVSISPSAIGVFSSEGTCVGSAKWGGTRAIAVAGENDVETGGLEEGERLRFRIYSASGWVVSVDTVSYLRCSTLSSGMGPICRDHGLYEKGTVYVLEKLTIGEPEIIEIGDGRRKESGLVQGLEATYTNGAVRLQWQAAGEASGTGFEVQRKAPKAGRWERLGVVEGSGGISGPKSYRFADENPPYEADSLSYRLEQFDDNGTVGYSEEITVRRAVEQAKLLGPTPNPTSQRATLRYAVPEQQEVSIFLYDVLGRRVRTVVSGEEGGRRNVQLNVSNLSSGTYFLRLKAGGATRTQRLTVAR